MAEEMKLPDQDIFTKEQLSKRWKCDQSKIDAYIDGGQLKQALPPAARNGLRRWTFYRCADNEALLDAVKHTNQITSDSSEWLLDLIEDGELLEGYVGKASQEKIISCPKHLYIPNDEKAIINKQNPYTLEGEKKSPDLVRYFYDLNGNALIPLRDKGDGYRICFAPVEKYHLRSPVIRIEEVRRFIRKNKKTPSATVTPKEESTQKEWKTSNIHSQEGNEEDKQPATPERMLRLHEVRKRVGLSRSHIYTLMDKGEFPQSVKLTGGRSIAWAESVINAWIEKRKKTDE